jgi:hypothetical protein
MRQQQTFSALLTLPAAAGRHQVGDRFRPRGSVGKVRLWGKEFIGKVGRPRVTASLFNRLRYA